MKDCYYLVFRGSSVGRMMKDCNYTVFRGSMQRGADDEGLLLSRV